MAARHSDRSINFYRNLLSGLIHSHRSENIGDMKNQVIEVLDSEHGKKVIQYWKDRGVDTSDFNGSSTKSDGDEFRYYGVIDGCFDNYCVEYVMDAEAEIITLPEPEWKPKRGDRVLVWNIEGHETEAIFIAEIEGGIFPIVAVSFWYEEKFNKGEKFLTDQWKNMKPLPQVKEVTMQEIADKFGVTVEQLKIKNQ